MKTFFFVFTFLFAFIQLSYSQSKRITVAKDGSGDYTTVQQAIDAVVDSNKLVTIIYIRNGVYKEKLMLHTSKMNVHFIGESVDKTVLTYDDYAQKKDSKGRDIGTSPSASFFIFGAGFTAENITFENSSGPVGQAVAVRVTGDRAKFINCRFLGFQDTLYAHAGSRKNLLGDNASKELIEKCSNHLQVTASASPAFIVHAYNDKSVNVKNSLMLYNALVEKNVASSLHVFPQGGHAIALRNNPGSTEQWTALCEAWMIAE